MKTWSVIFNLFSALFLIYLVWVMHQDLRDNERQINELRLQYALDYATEAAFMSSLEGGNLGMTYEDMERIRINPENTLTTFKSIMALNYNMALTESNLNSLDAYINGAVIAVADGYYVADLVEVDTDKESTIGNEYELRWGLKKPYLIKEQTLSGNYVSYNLTNENWHWVRSSGVIVSGTKWADLSLGGVDRNIILKNVNERIATEVNYVARKRAEAYSGRSQTDFLYLPFQRTETGINAITKPSMLVVLSGVDFSGSQKLNAKSVGGYTVISQQKVIGLVDSSGGKFYCYEDQIEGIDLTGWTVQKFFRTVDEAARDGYRPHMEWLLRPVERE